MQRNKVGINIDQGIPLRSNEDFELLYVPISDGISAQLSEWIRNATTPILLGGQIGIGKSTTIEYLIKNSTIKPDITLHFDRESMNLSAGDFLRLVLAGFIQFALQENVDLTFTSLPKELSGLGENDWQGLDNKMAKWEMTLAASTEKIELSRKLGENSHLVNSIIMEIAEHLEKKINRRLFVFASGIDKFPIERSAFFELHDVIETLATFKTLFEVNAIHLFAEVFRKMDKCLLPVLNEKKIVTMLTKRMGIYEEPVRNEILLLSKWSGGNPRQALRLLSYFEIERKNQKSKRAVCITSALHATIRDFFAFSSKPSDELMKNIIKEKTISASLITLPGDKETARKAIYGNWIFLSGKAESDKWRATINPLVKAYFNWKDYPLEPEVQALNDFADQAGMSPYGLSLQMYKDSGKEKKDSHELFLDIMKAGAEQPPPLNLIEILDVMASALLSKNRSDRVIIAYKNEDIIDAARAYLFAKSNSYEYQRYKHVTLIGGPDKKPLENFLSSLNTDTDILSYDFIGNWTEDQLLAIEKQRDNLIERQIIWWIELNSLKKYLLHWVQLRQLFEIFILEDELLGSIKIEEVKSDLDFINELVEHDESAEGNYSKNLKIVLEYLQKAKEGANG